jgi:hypothetical protein
MSETTNQFNDAFLQRRLADNPKGEGFTKKPGGHSEEQFVKVYEGITFTISRGHAYKDHATGPATNARFGGSPEIVETAIMKDAYWRFKAGLLKGPGKIAAMGTGIIFRHIPIRYNAMVRGDTSIAISDYMVWQGTVDKPVEAKGVYQFPKYDDAEYADEVTKRQFPGGGGAAKKWEDSLPVDNDWRAYS